MYDQDTIYPILNHWKAEHRRLNDRISQLATMLSHWKQRKEADALDQVRTELNAIDDELTRHFEVEDLGGCLDDAVFRCPRLGAEAGRLKSEQTLILHSLHAVQRDLQARDAAQHIEQEIEQDLEHVCDWIHRHEADEDRLVSSAFGRCV